MSSPLETLTPIASPDSKPLLKRREARKAANDRAWKVASRDSAETFECGCECVNSWCEWSFMVSPSDFWDARRHRRLAVSPGHVDLRLEREWARHDDWIEVVAPNAPGGTPDIETLKHHVEYVDSELENTRSQLTATTGRIATSLATGALVISLAAALLPEDLDRVGFVFFLIGLLLFLPIAWIALHRPQDIEENLIASGESLQKRLERWEKDPVRTLRTSPLWIGSYEQRMRIQNNDLAMTGQMFPDALLGEGDYLVAEVNTLHLELADVTERLERARRVLRQLNGRLLLFFVYLIFVVALIRLL